jgi:hypothetical protein
MGRTSSKSVRWRVLATGWLGAAMRKSTAKFFARDVAATSAVSPAVSRHATPDRNSTNRRGREVSCSHRVDHSSGEVVVFIPPDAVISASSPTCWMESSRYVLPTSPADRPVRSVLDLYDPSRQNKRETCDPTAAARSCDCAGLTGRTATRGGVWSRGLLITARQRGARIAPSRCFCLPNRAAEEYW